MNKKGSIIVVLVTLIFSCSQSITPNNITKIESVNQFYGIDFRPYTEKGFLFTPKDYDGEYQSIGIIEYKAMPAAEYERTLIEGTTGTYQAYSSTTWIVEDLVLTMVMDD